MRNLEGGAEEDRERLTDKSAALYPKKNDAAEHNATLRHEVTLESWILASIGWLVRCARSGSFQEIRYRGGSPLEG